MQSDAPMSREGPEAQDRWAALRQQLHAQQALDCFHPGLRLPSFDFYFQDHLLGLVGGRCCSHLPSSRHLEG